MLRLVSDENFNGDIVRGLFADTLISSLSACKMPASCRRLTPTSWSGPPAKGACCYRMTSQQSPGRVPTCRRW